MKNKTDFGFKLDWATTKDYSASILFFEHIGSKIPMHVARHQEKTWFINSGTFLISWIDTDNGKEHNKIIQEGSVFHIPPMMPVGIESKYASSTIMQVTNIVEDDKSIIIKEANNDTSVFSDT